jgi:uncharacterized protein (TIGR03382 family)
VAWDFGDGSAPEADVVQQCGLVSRTHVFAGTAPELVSVAVEVTDEVDALGMPGDRSATATAAATVRLEGKRDDSSVRAAGCGCAGNGSDSSAVGIAVAVLALLRRRRRAPPS